MNGCRWLYTGTLHYLGKVVNLYRCKCRRSAFKDLRLYTCATFHCAQLSTSVEYGWLHTVPGAFGTKISQCVYTKKKCVCVHEPILERLEVAFGISITIIFNYTNLRNFRNVTFSILPGGTKFTVQ